MMRVTETFHTKSPCLKDNNIKFKAKSSLSFNMYK